MFNFFNKKKKSSLPEFSNQITLSEPEKSLFERALKLYIFIHQVPHNTLDIELREQFKQLGNIVYSLIYNWLKDKKPSLDYMAFLNEKMTELGNLHPNNFKPLSIKINEISEIELSNEARFTFRDEESGQTIFLLYIYQNGVCRFSDFE